MAWDFKGVDAYEFFGVGSSSAVAAVPATVEQMLDGGDDDKVATRGVMTVKQSQVDAMMAAAIEKSASIKAYSSEKGSDVAVSNLKELVALNNAAFSVKLGSTTVPVEVLVGE